MKLGYFAPLPPAPTGVADYAATLLDALRKHGQVDVEPRDCDVALYHIGNNHLHREVYERAIQRPGVAVLHDAVLQHFFLGMLDEFHYTGEFVFNYGEWMRGLAADLWKNRARSAAETRYIEYPMLKRIATVSKALIVHNPAAARAVEKHAPDARVIEIPHLFVPPELPSKIDITRFRDRLGLHPRALLIGVFGHLRESKRVPSLLRAMARVWDEGVDARLLIAGAFASSDLERALASQLGDARIIRRDYLPEPEFWRYASATDVCVNLRYPTAGETSGIAVRMMGIGKPVIFTAGEEIARIPENACLRVDAGPAEEEMLAETLLWLARNPDAANEIGRRAAAHIREHHAMETIAAQYRNALNKL
jgi:glycosyltransferase involved in cell wall biosynthesis